MPGRAFLAAVVLFVSLAFLTASTQGRRSERVANSDSQYSAAEIEARLESPVVADFDETPIAEFARRVARSAGVPIRLDWESMANEGVTPETAITINLSQPVQARTLFVLALEPLHLHCRPSADSASWVVSGIQLNDVYRCVYSIADFKTAPEKRQLLESLADTIDGLAPSERTAQCRLAIAGDTIVVEQPQIVHESIADALDLFRRSREREARERQREQARMDQARWNALPYTDANDLTSTDIWPYPEIPIQPQRNAVYCASFQLAWTEFQANVIGSEPLLADNPSFARTLNRRSIGPEDLSSEACSIMCQREVDRIVIEARLLKDLEFAEPFERLEKGLAFQAATGVRIVAAFGVQEYDEGMGATWGKQVTVLSYQNEHDFILQLETEPHGDKVVLARIEPRETLASTIAAVESRLDKGSDSRVRPRLEAGESLAIPLLAFKVQRNYPELTGALLNSGWEGWSIETARETTSFHLTEQGAALESTAELEAVLGLEAFERSPPRRFVLDGPFLLFLKQPKAKHPYFAMWIANHELMEPLSPIRR